MNQPAVVHESQAVLHTDEMTMILTALTVEVYQPDGELKTRGLLVDLPAWGAVVFEVFQGRQQGSIFGMIMLAALAGGAAGPWVTGLLYDRVGDYTLAFAIAMVVSGLSALSIWQAAPRKVRAVAGRLHELKPGTGVQ